MTYRPNDTKYSDSFGPMGKSIVQFNTAGDKVRVSMEHYDKASQSILRDIFVVLRSNCPTILRPGAWIVSMSSDKQKIVSIKPVDGVFKAKFVGIRHDQDKEPAPEHNDKYDYWYFRPIFELTDENLKGIKVYYQYGLFYYFASETDNQGRLLVKYSKNLTKSSHTQELDEFLTITGVWEKGPMPYKPNPPSVLPYILKRGLSADKDFHVIMKDGWVKSLAV